RLQEEVLEVVGHRTVTEAVAAEHEMGRGLPRPRAVRMVFDETPPGPLRILSGPPLRRGEVIEAFGRGFLLEDRPGAVELAKPQVRDAFVERRAGQVEDVAEPSGAAERDRLPI